MSKKQEKAVFLFGAFSFKEKNPTITVTTRADNPGQPTGGHDTFCGGQGWTTGGHRWGKISCCIQNIEKIVTRTYITFVDTPAFTSALSTFVICLFCLSYICSAAVYIATRVHMVPK